MTTSLRTALTANPASTPTIAAAIAENHMLAIDSIGANDIGLDLASDPYKAVLYQSTVFNYDATDTTTAQDGTTCLVSLDGKRFKSGSPVILYPSVKSATTTAPPGSPVIGDRYIVPASPTGDWAGQADKVAVRQDAGWAFHTPARGEFFYVEDTDSYSRYTGSAWVGGLGANALADGDVRIPKLNDPLGLSVENATTNTPPGSPSTNVAYIIAASPTGAWSGQAGNVAQWNGSAWDILTTYEGARVYDKLENQPRIYDGSTWVLSGPGASKGFASSRPADGNTGSIARVQATGTISNDTATQSNTAPITQLTYTPKSGSNLIEILVSGVIWSADNITSVVVAIFRGAETEPLFVRRVSSQGNAQATEESFSVSEIFDPAQVDFDTAGGSATAEREYRLQVGFADNTESTTTLNWANITFAVKEMQDL